MNPEYDENELDLTKPSALRPEELRRGQFTFYASFFEAVDRLPRSRQLETYRAIVQYALNGTEPELTGGPAVVFTAVQPILENGRTKAAARLSSSRRAQVE